MDEVTYLTRTIRIYRHAFASILNVVVESGSTAARDVMQHLREAQWRLDKLKTMAPPSIDPTAARERKHIAALEAWR